jgi:alpha-D-ribose 1-methylphosphonate 5-triphosphate synthase subunit PhnG
MKSENKTTKLIKEIKTKIKKVEELNKQIINASQIDYHTLIDTLTLNNKERY